MSQSRQRPERKQQGRCRATLRLIADAFPPNRELKNLFRWKFLQHASVDKQDPPPEMSLPT